MPASRTHRHRLTAPLLGAVLGLGLLAGCAGQGTPDGYGDGVERAFLRGCESTARGDIEGGGTADASLDVDSYCQCAYDELRQNVEFGEFKSVNEDQVEEPGPLPESFQRVFEGCRTGAAGEGAGSTTEADGGGGGEGTTTTEGPDQDGTTTTEG
ncbi:MAG TPA: hypothetical protein VHK88_00470 [Aquihabitans sp.]|nr:hypothetical protein [Aquihabitans sp.]